MRPSYHCAGYGLMILIFHIYFSVPDGQPNLHRSFIASVNLKTSIIYSGQIRAFWDQAKANIKDSPKTMASTKADKYIVVLTQVNKSEIIDQALLQGLTFAYDFGGIEINTEYIINLTCVFGERKFECGTSR